MSLIISPAALAKEKGFLEELNRAYDSMPDEKKTPIRVSRKLGLFNSVSMRCSGTKRLVIINYQTDPDVYCEVILRERLPIRETIKSGETTYDVRRYKLDSQEELMNEVKFILNFILDDSEYNRDLADNGQIPFRSENYEIHYVEETTTPRINGEKKETILTLMGLTDKKRRIRRFPYSETNKRASRSYGQYMIECTGTGHILFLTEEEFKTNFDYEEEQLALI